MPPANTPTGLPTSSPTSRLAPDGVVERLDSTVPGSATDFPSFSARLQTIANQDPPGHQQRSITPLSYLSSPVPDFAATLYTHPIADAADEANADFLRDSLESLERVHARQEDGLLSNARRREELIQQADMPRSRDQPTSNQIHAGARDESVQARNAGASHTDTTEDRTRRERLQRVLARLNRLHDPPMSTNTAYSNRTPSPRQQSLYDWAPTQNTSSAATVTGEQNEAELERILTELRQRTAAIPEFNTTSEERPSSTRRPRDAATGSGLELADIQERRDRLRGERERRRQNLDWTTVRTRAYTQRPRPERSPSATERILRYMTERERSGLSEEEERAQSAGWFRPAVSRNDGNEGLRAASPSTYIRESWPLPPAAPGEPRARLLPRAHPLNRVADQSAPRLPYVATSAGTSENTPSSSVPPLLENAIKYLDVLRSCYGYEESLSAVVDHYLATKEFLADRHDDFIMDLSDVHLISPSSWLQPGSIFEGHQQANTNGLSPSLPRSGSSSQTVQQINPNYRSSSNPSTILTFDHPPGSTRVVTFGSWLNSHVQQRPMDSAPTKNPDTPLDHWPVRVIIHTIDSDKMILQGTMEAYDVPQQPSTSLLHAASTTGPTTHPPKAGNKDVPITTYVEGHFIDLTTHSFLTPSKPSPSNKPTTDSSPASSNTPTSHTNQTISFPPTTAANDAHNWRKLAPFNTYPSDDALARAFLSRSALAALREKYIFMRWKERCFVHAKNEFCTDPPHRHTDQDRGHGLTISGFYYVSLRRADGRVEGLYFDPNSTPYQHLLLHGRSDGWPAFEFR